MFFRFSLGHFVFVLLAFVVFDLVSSLLRQEIGWKERLRNYLFCIEWNLKPSLNQSTWTNTKLYALVTAIQHAYQNSPVH